MAESGWLLDTSVVVDVLRGRAAASAWLDSLSPAVPCISAATVVEILAGCRSRREQRQADAELACYQILWPSEATFAAALTFYRRFQLSHGAGFLDCLVAATAAEHGLRLATLNLRHFQPLPGVESVRPYAD